MSFISYRRAIKLWFNNKVEILSSWNEIIRWVEGEMKLPATLRLKDAVPWRNKRARCSRKSVLRRDLYTCQYCGIVLSPARLTWDHVMPRCRKGRSVWENTVCACSPCNLFKGDRTPEEAGMKLFRKPVAPKRNIFNEYKLMSTKHTDWEFYMG